MSQAVKAMRKAFADMARESFVAEGKAGSIIRFLSRRFQKVPKSVKEKVCSITNIDRLDELTDHAATCQSMDEFAEAIR